MTFIQLHRHFHIIAQARWRCIE